MRLIVLVLFLFASVISISFGVYLGVTSASTWQSLEQMATVAAVCMLFAIALGVWVHPIMNLFGTGHSENDSE